MKILSISHSSVIADYRERMAETAVWPEVTVKVLEDVAKKGVKELFLNPGSESGAVLDRARELNLAPILACSIIDIGETPNRF